MAAASSFLSTMHAIIIEKKKWLANEKGRKNELLCSDINSFSKVFLPHLEIPPPPRPRLPNDDEEGEQVSLSETRH